MTIKDPKFEISAVSKKQYPTTGRPEIVLVRKIKRAENLHSLTQ